MSTRRNKRGASRSRAGVKRPTVNAGKLLRVLIVVGVVIIAGVTIPKIDWSMEQPVTEVAVVGEFNYLARSDVEKAVTPFIADDYLTVSLDEVRGAVEQLPWVYLASVRREWPGKLVIHITEQTPIAWWGADKLMNNKGGVFAPGQVELSESLPYLEGPSGTQADVMAYYIDIGQVLRSREMAVSSLKLSERGAWRASLVNGVELVFGRDQVMEKLQRFLSIFDLSLAKYFHRVERIDLRYGNGLAVTWSEMK